MITIFANIRINNAESLQHLKDSFYSFNTISDDWIINIRGSFRDEAISFLKKNLKEKMTLFELLDDSRGWINNSLEMIEKVKYNYLLVWNEDHLNIAPQNIYKKIIEEMEYQKADYLLYSWWQFYNVRKAFEILNLNNQGYIDTVKLTKKEWKKVIDNGYPYYLISLCGIFHKSFFKKILLKDRFKLPLFFTKNFYRLMTLINHIGLEFNQKKYFHLINKLLFHKLRRFSKETPFDIEKAPDRIDMLPIKLALSKQELFACIDDDLDMPGYQLIKRGKYPQDTKLIPINFLKENSKKNLEFSNDYEVLKLFLPNKEEHIRHYYEDEIRTCNLLRETILVMSGKVEIEIFNNNKHILLSGDSITLYPNIGYSINSLDDSNIIIIHGGLQNKKIKYIK